MHHIVSDGWSIAIFFRELSVLYEAYANGKASPLPELPIQYVDYAVWQRDWLKGEVLEEQLCYWRKQRVLAKQLIAVLERAQRIIGSEPIAGEERSQKRDLPVPSLAEV
jgi:hypothetical protein